MGMSAINRRVDNFLERLGWRDVRLSGGQGNLTVKAQRPFFNRAVALLLPGHARRIQVKNLNIYAEKLGEIYGGQAKDFVMRDSYVPVAKRGREAESKDTLPRFRLRPLTERRVKQLYVKTHQRAAEPSLDAFPLPFLHKIRRHEIGRRADNNAPATRAQIDAALDKSFSPDPAYVQDGKPPVTSEPRTAGEGMVDAPPESHPVQSASPNKAEDDWRPDPNDFPEPVVDYSKRTQEEQAQIDAQAEAAWKVDTDDFPPPAHSREELRMMAERMNAQQEASAQIQEQPENLENSLPPDPNKLPAPDFDFSKDALAAKSQADAQAEAAWQVEPDNQPTTQAAATQAASQSSPAGRGDTAKPVWQQPFALKLPENPQSSHRRFVSTPSPTALPPGEKFYHERQSIGDGSCATHAINGFLGGPVIAGDEFLHYQAQIISEETLMPVESVVEMLKNDDGGDPAIVEKYVRECATKGIADPRAEHTRTTDFRQIPKETSQETINALQHHYNEFPGDRLIFGNRGHFMALRRNEAGDWYAIDSLSSRQDKVNLGEVIVRQQKRGPTFITHMEPEFNFRHDGIETM